MSYLSAHWTLHPFLPLALLAACWHEAGLGRLARQFPQAARQRRLRSLQFYAGLAVLLVTVESPMDYWAEDYFSVHMVQHLLLMFAAPSLLVAGAPWQPLRAALPARARLPGPLRAAGRLLLRPWVAVGLFNVAMLVWHLPGPYDFGERNQAAHIWLMEASFLAAGTLFWLQFIGSPPFRLRLPPLGQAAALLGTNVVMIGIAMALSIFATRSVYPIYAHVPGVSLPPFADQQIGAGILWVCGDFWAMPTMVVIVRRMISSEGSMTAALDKVLNRGSARPGWGRPGQLAELRYQPPSSPEAGP